MKKNLICLVLTIVGFA